MSTNPMKSMQMVNYFKAIQKVLINKYQLSDEQVKVIYVSMGDNLDASIEVLITVKETKNYPDTFITCIINYNDLFKTEDELRKEIIT